MSTQRVIIAFSGALLLFAIVLWFALSRVESPSTEPEEPTQYPNEETTQAPVERTTSNYEKAPSHYEVQYPSELPDTGGIVLLDK